MGILIYKHPLLGAPKYKFIFYCNGEPKWQQTLMHYCMWQMRVLANTKAILHVQPSPCLHETNEPPPLETI